ncbi:MAG TPA: sensor histidine kinase [Bifidobacterium sp.]|nr:sensor histidine kinase [Bifidobacterium sp.]
MSETTNAPDATEVPVRTKIWCSAAMVVCSDFMCMAQTAFAAQRFDQDSAAYVWMVFCTLLSFAVGFLLLARSRYPRATFVTACIAVLVFPYDSTIELMALTALLSRRNDTRTSIRAIAAGGIVAIVSQVRDATRPPEASLWHAVFAKPDTGGQYGTALVMLADERTIVITAVVAALLELTIATLAGLHIRSRDLASLASAKADAADARAARLRTAIDSQQLADAIAAEAHDTLAHSLSLLALNASALHAESVRLGREANAMDPSRMTEAAERIAEKSEDIRKQAAGALDEAHSIIDMLRHPEQARMQLAPSDETSLTRDSLDALIGDARAAGMHLNTWIDIQQLGRLNDAVGKIAYRAIQEGMTNARRHAPEEPVSLEVSANPTAGVHVHVSNPTKAGTVSPSRPGAGLPGLAERVRKAGGTCRFGFDDRHAFHVDVRLPWVA